MRTPLSDLPFVIPFVNENCVTCTYHGNTIAIYTGKYCDLRDKPNMTQFNPSMYVVIDTPQYRIIANRYSSNSAGSIAQRTIDLYYAMRSVRCVQCGCKCMTTDKLCIVCRFNCK